MRTQQRQQIVTECTKTSLDLGDDGPGAFTKFMMMLSRTSMSTGRISGTLAKWRWHLTTILNTFNTYYCYDIHPTHVKEIRPIFLVHYGRLMGIRLDESVSGKPDTYTLFFDHYDTDTMTSEIKRVSFFDIRAIFFEKKKANTLDTEFYAPPPKWDRIDVEGRVSFLHSVKYDKAPPLEIDSLSGTFEWKINYKYVSPGRISLGESATGIPVIPEENAVYLYVLRTLFGATLSFINENMCEDYQRVSRLAGPPLTSTGRLRKLTIEAANLSKDEETLLRDIPVYSNDTYFAELEQKKKANDATLQSLDKFFDEALDRIQSLIARVSTSRRINTVEPQSLGAAYIDEPQTIILRETLEDTIATQLHRIDEYMQSIDETTRIVTELIQRITPVDETTLDVTTTNEDEDAYTTESDDDDMFIPMF